ncbi:hypothetical protein SDC9_130516 [bioreactor metagenome]|uniref:Uncharacterized protein n=1 Tax=bioreactor metagenome TaxID=1076179 RepID=A0A645D479_9ZZZZ
MRIVELDGNVLRKAVDGPVFAFKAQEDILQARAGEEILLLETQFFPRLGGVIRIQHARDILYGIFLKYRKGIFLIVKKFKVKIRNSLALPEAQRADVIRIVAKHGHVVGHGADGHIRKVHQHFMRIPPAAPGIAETRPIIRALNLKSVAERLLKKAIFIADSVAIQRQV